MFFSFSVVMTVPEPEVQAAKGETCCHCQPRLILLHRQDHDRPLHLKPFSFRLVVENVDIGSAAAVPSQIPERGKDLPDVGVELLELEDKNRRDQAFHPASGAHARTRIFNQSSFHRRSMFHLKLFSHCSLPGITCPLPGKLI